MARVSLSYLAVIGRILVGGFFLWNAIDAAINLNYTAAEFIALSPTMGIYLAIAAISVEAIAGILVVANVWTRYASIVLALFVILTAPFVTNFADPTQTALFLENMAVVGALLYIAATI